MRPPPQGEVDPSRIMSVGVTGVPMQAAKEKPPISVVGDVGGRIAIMVVSDVISRWAGAGWDDVIIRGLAGMTSLLGD